MKFEATKTDLKGTPSTLASVVSIYLLEFISLHSMTQKIYDKRVIKQGARQCLPFTDGMGCGKYQRNTIQTNINNAVISINTNGGNMVNNAPASDEVSSSTNLTVSFDNVNDAISKSYFAAEKTRADEPPRRFRHYPLGEGQSIASSLLGGNRRGIYIYRFSDGSWYIGKSVDVVQRHGQHLHELKHGQGLDGLSITDMWFMGVDPALGDRYLDEQETAAIEYADRAGWDLRNELKTGHPHGHEDFVAVLESGETLAFPWERPEGPSWRLDSSDRLTRGGQPGASNFERLRSASFYGQLRQTVAEYLQLTVHEAAATAGYLWSVSALPSTGRGSRLLTLSVSSLEVLYVLGSVDDSIDCIRVNCKRPDGDHHPVAPLLAGSRWPTREKYGACDGVHCYDFRSLAAFQDALHDGRFLDWCWRLNIEMMRKSPTFHTKGFNAGLARDLLGLDDEV